MSAAIDIEETISLINHAPVDTDALRAKLESLARDAQRWVATRAALGASDVRFDGEKLRFEPLFNPTEL